MSHTVLLYYKGLDVPNSNMSLSAALGSSHKMLCLIPQPTRAGSSRYMTQVFKVMILQLMDQLTTN